MRGRDWWTHVEVKEMREQRNNTWKSLRFRGLWFYMHVDFWNETLFVLMCVVVLLRYGVLWKWNCLKSGNYIVYNKFKLIAYMTIADTSAIKWFHRSINQIVWIRDESKMSYASASCWRQSGVTESWDNLVWI